MRTVIGLMLTIFVSTLGAIAFEQIRRHGKSRLWTVIPFVIGFSILMYLFFLPGHFLWGIID